MNRVCQDAAKLELPAKLVAAFGMTRFPKEIRDAAGTFVHLQDLRHHADYNPSIRFYKSDARDAIRRATSAIIAFETAEAGARRIFLLGLLLRSR